MRRLHTFKMKLQMENAKMTLYNLSFMLFPSHLSLVLSLLLPFSFSLCILSPFLLLVFSVAWLGFKTQLCFWGNDFLIKDR